MAISFGTVYKSQAESLTKRRQVSGAGKRRLSARSVHPAHPASQDYFIEVKSLLCESNPKKKNARRYTSTAPYALIIYCFI
jgi:hypothetical protein